MLDLNYTFFLQLISIIITLLFLNILLIRPIRAIIAQREASMEDSLHATEGFVQEADDKMADYTKKLDEARAEGLKARNALKDEGTVREKDLLSKAGEGAAVLLKNTRKELDSESAIAMTALKAEIDELAEKVTDKVLL